MTEANKTMALRLTDYEQAGLYLILKDSTRPALTRKNIEAITAKYWADPQKIPPHVKDAIEPFKGAHSPLLAAG
jgi:hypothetical protein